MEVGVKGIIEMIPAESCTKNELTGFKEEDSEVMAPVTKREEANKRAKEAMAIDMESEGLSRESIRRLLHLE